MNKSLKFKIVDCFYLVMTLLPILAGMIIYILFTPESEGVEITGALIYFTIDLPFFSSSLLNQIPITEAQVNSWLVMITILFLCLYLTHGIKAKGGLKRQLVAEWIVEQTEKLVNTNMDPYFSNFAPFVAAILGLSCFSSLLSLFGIFAPTSDINVVAGWAVLTFCLITYYKFKVGPLHYLKSFTEPVSFLTPINIISEVATPVSMSFRHYGNILSGSVISVLVAYGLGNLSNALLGWLTSIPILRIGIPAILSLYFDIFSGALQAYIFAMLTMLYVSGGFPAELYYKRRAQKDAKRKERQKILNS